MIIVKGTLDAPVEVLIAAEKQLICTVGGGLLEAHLSFMAVCYVFMFSYPASLNNVCIYFQKCILQIQDGKKLPTTVMTLVNTIDNIVGQMI